MYKRHDLVWLKPEGWQAALNALPERAAVFNYWQREDWPVAVRRADAGADPDKMVCTCLALPPDAAGVKQRIPLHTAIDHVDRSMPPPALKAVRVALPTPWRNGFAELERLSAGLDFRVYGSLAWQALTTLPTLTEASDIDILFRPVNRHQLQAGLALLDSTHHGLPLNGEIMFPSGDAVMWREWLTARQAGARVLTKSVNGVRLAELEELTGVLRQ